MAAGGVRERWGVGRNERRQKGDRERRELKK